MKMKSKIKKLKVVCSVILCAASLAILVVPLYAAAPEEVAPCFENVRDASPYFSISSSGLATLGCSIKPIANVTQVVAVRIKIEKKTLFFFWTEVDIGRDGNIWVLFLTKDHTSESVTFQLPKKGTYRGSFLICPAGSAAPTEENEVFLEVKYE